MKNFRQYPNAKIEFSQSVTKNFTVIQGVNGAGKTNILNAVTWCLFGDEKHIDKKCKGLPIVNSFALSKCKDTTCEVKVELQLIQSDGKRIRIARCEKWKEQNNNLSKVATAHDFLIMREIERDWVGPIYGDDAQYIVDSLIPPAIEEYFFFDGERMNDYFKENTGKDIKSAVFKISQLELCNSLIEHLSARKTEYLRLTRGLSPEADKIRDLIAIYNNSQQKDIEQKNKLEAEYEEAELHEKEYSDKLRDSSLENIESLESERAALVRELGEINGDIDELEKEKINFLHKNMLVIFAFDALTRTKSLIDAQEEAGMIPSPVQNIFIDGLLKKGECICGSNIAAKDESSCVRRKKVEEFLKQNELSEMTKDLINCNIQIQTMIDQLENFQANTVKLSKKLRDLEEKKRQKNRRVEQIDSEISKSDFEEIRDWEKKRGQWAEEKRKKDNEIAILKRQIDRRESILKANNLKLDQELKKEAKHNSLVNLRRFCEDGIRAAEEVRDSIMRNVKDEVCRKTSEQFLSLIWKKGVYKGVTIDDDYNISVLHISGREGIGSLSAGERQVCALSFMAALNSVSGFDVPIIIDTPLARISNVPTRNIAENLPRYLPNKQVSLLVTDKEFTSEVKQTLNNVVGKTYLINFTEKDYGGLSELVLQT
jgi:DNA sulfur modification protein DndD